MTTTLANPSGDPRNVLLAAALEHAGRGWHVFPLRPGSKTPALHSTARCRRTGVCVDGHQTWEQRATLDPDRVTATWSQDAYNIGIATGPSGLVVIDLDRAKPGDDVPEHYQGTGIRTGQQVLADLEGVNGDLPATYTVTTPSGGRHLYYTAPDLPGPARLGNTAGRLGWLIDTRARGGYVVAPGSVTPAGPYAPTGPHTTVAALPDWVTTLLRTEPPLATGPDVPADEAKRRDFVAAAVCGELTRVLRSPANGHNTALFQAASQLGQLVAGGLLDRATVHAALVAVGVHVGQRGHEAAATVNSGLRNGARQPRGPHTGQQTNKTQGRAA